MQIFVKSLAGRTITLDVEPSDAVEHVKSMIEDVEGVPTHEQRLVCAGKQLVDGCTLADHVVQSGSNVDLLMNLRGGGKVHGSLARAGKVKNQTPKVAKQDKKKKPRGRALKRQKYNRRFVNVIKGAKKVGPNNNAERLRREQEAAGAA